MVEEYRFIKGYEKDYMVSNTGKIKSFKNKKCIYLKILYNHKGYPQVSLFLSSQKKSKRIHRLVAEAFIPNPDDKPQVNHINGIKTDNRVENLEWCTNRDNIIHAYKNGLIKRPLILKSQKMVQEINDNGEIIQIFKSIEDASRLTNISAAAISYNIKGFRMRTKKGIPVKYIVTNASGRFFKIYKHHA